MAEALLRRPRRKRPPGLMLIPLVDVIFLLLTFFILASRIDPFSLLTLDEYRIRSEGQGAADGAPPLPDLIVAVSRASVQANGETVPLAAFAARSAALRKAGLETVTLFTRPSATVQDITTVLDALKKASFRSVVIRGGAGAGPG
jgi:biopolymer transport protein ExbD